MAGRLLVAQQTATARVRTLSSTAATRLMRNAIRTRRGVVKSITILAPLLEANKYIVLSLPSKVIQQFMAYLSSLNVSKRQAFVSGWISKNQVALITQHAKSGYKSRFSFKIEPIPKVQSTTSVPRRVAPVPRRTTPRTTPRPAPARRLTLVPLKPKITRGLGTASKPYILAIPIPSRAKRGSVILHVDMPIRVSYARGFRRRVVFRFTFTTTNRKSNRVKAADMERLLSRIVMNVLQAKAQRHELMSSALVYRNVRKILKMGKSYSDIKNYIIW